MRAAPEERISEHDDDHNFHQVLQKAIGRKKQMLVKTHFLMQACRKNQLQDMICGMCVMGDVRPAIWKIGKHK